MYSFSADNGLFEVKDTYPEELGEKITSTFLNLHEMNIISDLF